MRNQDLILPPAKPGGDALSTPSARPGHLSVRLQPNHPTDDLKGIAASMPDGLLYGAGDAVIGINPASDSFYRCLAQLNVMLDGYSALRHPYPVLHSDPCDQSRRS